MSSSSYFGGGGSRPPSSSHGIVAQGAGARRVSAFARRHDDTLATNSSADGRSHSGSGSDSDDEFGHARLRRVVGARAGERDDVRTVGVVSASSPQSSSSQRHSSAAIAADGPAAMNAAMKYDEDDERRATGPSRSPPHSASGPANDDETDAEHGRSSGSLACAAPASPPKTGDGDAAAESPGPHFGAQHTSGTSPPRMAARAPSAVPDDEMRALDIHDAFALYTELVVRRERIDDAIRRLVVMHPNMLHAYGIDSPASMRPTVEGGGATPDAHGQVEELAVHDSMRSRSETPSPAPPPPQPRRVATTTAAHAERRDEPAVAAGSRVMTATNRHASRSALHQATARRPAAAQGYEPASATANHYSDADSSAAEEPAQPVSRHSGFGASYQAALPVNGIRAAAKGGGGGAQRDGFRIIPYPSSSAGDETDYGGDGEEDHLNMEEDADVCKQPDAIGVEAQYWTNSQHHQPQRSSQRHVHHGTNDTATRPMEPRTAASTRQGIAESTRSSRGILASSTANHQARDVPDVRVEDRREAPLYFRPASAASVTTQRRQVAAGNRGEADDTQRYHHAAAATPAHAQQLGPPSRTRSSDVDDCAVQPRTVWSQGIAHTISSNQQRVVTYAPAAVRGGAPSGFTVALRPVEYGPSGHEQEPSRPGSVRTPNPRRDDDEQTSAGYRSTAAPSAGARRSAAVVLGSMRMDGAAFTIAPTDTARQATSAVHRSPVLSSGYGPGVGGGAGQYSEASSPLRGTDGGRRLRPSAERSDGYDHRNRPLARVRPLNAPTDERPPRARTAQEERVVVVEGYVPSDNVAFTMAPMLSGSTTMSKWH